MTPFEVLEELNGLDEHPRIEAKEGSAMGRSILETVCAFANEPGMGGGWLILGVKADEQSFWRQYEVIGVPHSDQMQSDLASQCAISFNVPIRPRIEVAEIQGKRIISVFVPESPASAKPIFFAATGLPKGAYRRIGSADVRCTAEDMVVFYGEHSATTMDVALLPDGEIEEIDPDALVEYRRLKAQTNPGAEELQWSDPELLRALRCADKDAGGVLRPTVAGVLLFGKTTALRRHFPMMRVDYIRVPGKKWVEDPHHRFDTLEIRAPLIRLVGRAINAILDELPKAFSLQPESIHRQDLPLIPTRVLREVVVNAVMHRSYKIHGAVQIIRYSNRLEIRNPGYSLVSEDRWGEPGSVSRNPHLAAVLHEVNLAETKGSGIRVMRELMRDLGLTPPTFDSDRHNDQFIATLLFHHFLGQEDWAWLRSLSVSALIDEEARALVYVRETSSIDNATYRDLNRVDALNASHHLRRLRDQGFLDQRGKGSATFYVPGEKFLASLSPETPTSSGALSGNPAPLSGNPAPLSGNLGGLSGNRPPLIDTLPDFLQKEVALLKQRASLEALNQLVLDVCRVRPFTADELATLLARNRKYMQDRVLAPLRSQGALMLTIPDQPHHPDQAYSTPPGTGKDRFVRP